MEIDQTDFKPVKLRFTRILIHLIVGIIAGLWGSPMWLLLVFQTGLELFRGRLSTPGSALIEISMGIFGWFIGTTIVYLTGNQ